MLEKNLEEVQEKGVNDKPSKSPNKKSKKSKGSSKKKKEETSPQKTAEQKKNLELPPIEDDKSRNVVIEIQKTNDSQESAKALQKDIEQQKNQNASNAKQSTVNLDLAKLFQFAIVPLAQNSVISKQRKMIQGDPNVVKAIAMRLHDLKTIFKFYRSKKNFSLPKQFIWLSALKAFEFSHKIDQDRLC